jgi:hypothetical protein
MGYYVTLTSTKLHIPAHEFSPICEHLLSTGFLTNTDSMGGGSYQPDGKTEAWYSWVDMKALTKHLNDHDLDAVLEDFGFDVFLDRDGNITDLHYDDKTGDEGKLFECMAPALKGTLHFYWSGEGGAMWKWLIRDGKLFVIDANISYPDPEV